MAMDGAETDLPLHDPEFLQLFGQLPSSENLLAQQQSYECFQGLGSLREIELTVQARVGSRAGVQGRRLPRRCSRNGGGVFSAGFASAVGGASLRSFSKSCGPIPVKATPIPNPVCDEHTRPESFSVPSPGLRVMRIIVPSGSGESIST